MVIKDFLRLIKNYGASFLFQKHLCLRKKFPKAYIAAQVKIRYDDIRILNYLLAKEHI